MSGHDVNEATLALKSMLNIGGSASSDTGTSTPPAVVVEEPKKKQQKSGGPRKKGKKKSSQPQKQQSQTKGPPQTNKASETKQDSKKKKKKNVKSSEGPENFAWSAFQSSPDASALPIPAFVSPQSGKTTVPEHILNSEQIFAPLDAGNSLGHKKDAENRASEVLAIEKKGPGTVSSSDPDESKASEGEARRRTNGPVGSTGVNLAALSTPPAQRQSSVPHTAPGMHRSMPQGAPPGAGAPMYPPPNPHFHPHSHSHPPGVPYPQSAPMGYVTIHVQVPPTLLPGRQMVVASPAGYHVRVAVPEGVGPGTVIPVHVPAPPMMMAQPPTLYQFGGGPTPPPQSGGIPPKRP